MKRRLLSLTMAVVVTLGACPTNVIAAETTDTQVVESAMIEKTEATEDVEQVGTEQVQYVLMNIPYDDFYKADLRENTVKVDAFSSATLNKTRTGSLVAGSYHVNADGSDISGVTFPVKIVGDVELSTLLSGYKQITDQDSVTIEVTNRGQTSSTTYSGKDALFESENYSYYVLNEEPSYYKELTVTGGKLSFGKIQGTSQQLENVTATLTTNTTYGDYELDLEGLVKTTSNGVVTGGYIDSSEPIYGVIISTEEGVDYGLRHMENIWLVSELAWGTGFTEKVHNCTMSYQHYESMMGKTINKVTYYTANGIYEIPIDDIYVPVKFNYSISVEDALFSSGNTKVTLPEFPSGYQPEYSVEGLSDVAVDIAGNLTYNATTAKQGSYTLKVTDTSKTYVDISAEFVLSTETNPASYNSDSAAPALVKAANASEEDFADFIKNIATVSVNGTSYAATGRNAVVIINTDGTVKTDAAAFAEDGEYTIVVSSTAYPDYSFTYVKEAVVSQTAQTITATSAYNKTFGDAAFTLDAKTSGNGALSYISSNANVATVDAAGKVTIKGAGTATITVTAAATEQNTAATKTITINVAKRAQTVTATSSYIKVNGAKAFTVTAATNGDGALNFTSSNKNVVTVNASTGKVTVKGVGKATISVYAKAGSNYNQSAVKTITITVNPKASKVSKVTAAKKKLTVKVQKVSGVTGYQVQYSTSKNFTKATTSTKKVTKTTASLTKLKSGKKYYVRVRAYKKVSGKTYYSAWSAKTTKTTK